MDGVKVREKSWTGLNMKPFARMISAQNPKFNIFRDRTEKWERFEDLKMSSSAGARSVLGNMTNLRLGPDTGLLRPGIKTHVTGGIYRYS